MIDFLRLRGLRPVRVEESDNDLHVYAESTQAVSACVHCASPTIVGFGRHERLVRDDGLAVRLDDEDGHLGRELHGQLPLEEGDEVLDEALHEHHGQH